MVGETLTLTVTVTVLLTPDPNLILSFLSLSSSFFGLSITHSLTTSPINCLVAPLMFTNARLPTCAK